MENVKYKIFQKNKHFHNCLCARKPICIVTFFLYIFQLLSLDLSNNKLYRLDHMSEIHLKSPNLKILNLSNNVVSLLVFIFLSVLHVTFNYLHHTVQNTGLLFFDHRYIRGLDTDKCLCLAYP